MPETSWSLNINATSILKNTQKSSCKKSALQKVIQCKQCLKIKSSIVIAGQVYNNDKQRGQKSSDRRVWKFAT